MSIRAIYVFTATEFDLDVASKIEQLVKDESNRYTVVTRLYEAGKSFTLQPGVYRLTSTATITATHGFRAAEISATDTMPTTGHIIAPAGTKTAWPPPPATAASAALNIPLAEMKPFLADAGAQSVLGPAPSLHR